MVDSYGKEIGPDGPIDKQKGGYIKLSFSATWGPLMHKSIVKKFAMSENFMFIRQWAGQTFKLFNMSLSDLKFRNHEKDCYELIEDDTKNLDYYGLVEGSEILIDLKQGEVPDSSVHG